MTNLLYLPAICLFWWSIPFIYPIPHSVISKKKIIIGYYRSLAHAVFVVCGLTLYPNYFPLIISSSQCYFIVDSVVTDNNWMIIIHHIVSIIGLQMTIIYPYLKELVVVAFMILEFTNIISHMDTLLQFSNLYYLEKPNIVSYILIRNIFGGYYSYYMFQKTPLYWSFILTYSVYNIIYLGGLYWSFHLIKNYRKKIYYYG